MKRRRTISWTFVILLCLPVAFLAAEPPDPARVEQLAASLSVGTFCPTPAVDRRDFWGKVGDSPLFEDILAEAQQAVGRAVKPLPDDLYLEYSKNGNRSRYQNVYFRKLKALRALVVAECVENKGRFVEPIRRMVESYAADKTWVLPAHDAGLENFKGQQITIDLFASEVACDLAATDYLLGEHLSDATRQLIRSEVTRRIFTPYSSMVREGRPGMWWLTGTNNWNAVCLANVTGAALSLLENPHERAFYVAAAEKYIAYFLTGFTDDGYCSEGIGYWNYGFGCFVRLGHILDQATGGKVDLFGMPKARNAALFARRMEITPGRYPAFADCTVGSKPDPNIMAYVTRRYDLAPTARELGGYTAPRWLDEWGVYSFVFDAAAQGEVVAELPTRDWFEDAEILICRGAKTRDNLPLGIAAKGGHNAEHHNHNDVGSFVVCVGDAMPLTDPGAEEYTRRTFSRDRYLSGVLNSFGHPVPRVAGQLQRTGRDAAARVLQCDLTEENDSLVLDLSAAYRVESLESLTRSIEFRRQPAKVTLTDEVRFASPQSFGTALITFGSWKRLADDRLQVGEGRGAVVVQIDSGGLPVTVDAVSIDEDVRGGKKPVRLGIDIREPVREAMIRLTIQPLEDR